MKKFIYLVFFVILLVITLIATYKITKNSPKSAPKLEEGQSDASFFRTNITIPEFSFNGITQKNRNGLLKDRFADGLKTGKTDAGKCGIIASSIRHGRRLMLVLNGIETELIREEEARRLLNWGFQFFQPVVFFKKNQKVVDVPLWKGETLALIAPQTIGVSLPRRLLQQVKVTIKYPTPLMRPILKGQKVGILSITVPNQAPMEFPLIAAEEAPETGLFHFIWGKKAKK